MPEKVGLSLPQWMKRGSPPALRQFQHQCQDQESKVDTLPRMSNDTKPGTAKVSARESIENYPINCATEDTPRLMQMIQTKQQPIDHPIPFAKDTGHARQ